MSFSFLSPTLFYKTLSLIKYCFVDVDRAYVGRLNIDSANQKLLRECLNRLKHVMVSIFSKITINNSGNIKTMLRRFVCRLILACLFFFSVPESEYPLDDVQKQCRNSLCECDSKAAKCFASSSFNHSYINYNTNKC